MMIPINKDFEMEFKDEAIAGYTITECLWIGIILLMDAIVFCFFTFVVGLTSDITIYLCIPLTMGLGFLGFKKYQGMSVFQRISAMQKEKEHTRLLWIAGENWSEDSVFLENKLSEQKKLQKEAVKKEKELEKQRKKDLKINSKNKNKGAQ